MIVRDRLELPCGAVLNNRIAKAAMTERLSRRTFAPNNLHLNLYAEWAKIGAGLMITGNVMVDKKHMESAGNVAISKKYKKAFINWAESGKAHGNHFWMQLNHAGRQTSRFVNLNPLSPSSVQLKKMGLFGKPKPMLEIEIIAAINAFCEGAAFAKETGFSGVEIHAAHGYLINQFLSPHTNKRHDKWGGSLENRMRFLLEIIRGVRKEVGPDFPVGVKINSEDFQSGGFTDEESLAVIQKLEEEGIDLLEISGGTYEKVAFLDGVQKKENTIAREAYFIEFAEKVKQFSKIPLMVTGGFRTSTFISTCISQNKLEVAGLARPFLCCQKEIKTLLSSGKTTFKDFVIVSAIPSFLEAAKGGFYNYQIRQLAKGKPTNWEKSGTWSAFDLVFSEFFQALSKRLARLIWPF